MNAVPGAASRTDLRALLSHQAIDPGDTVRWLSRQQLPDALRRLGLERPARDFLGALWAGLLDDLSDGIVITETDEIREVVIARTAVVRIEQRTQAIQADIRGYAGTEEDVLIEVGQPFPQLLWLDAVLSRHAELLQVVRDALLAASFARNAAGCNHAQSVDDSISEVVPWARKCVRRRLERTMDLVALRTRITSAYALEASFMAIVRRARPEASLSVHSSFWNLCVKHRHQLERTAEYGPGLLRLLGEMIVAGNIDPKAAPLAVLKKNLQQHGATAADWKRLLVDRAAPVWRLRDEERLSRYTETSAHLAAWARIHRGLPHEASLPSPMWLVIAQGATQQMTNRLLVPSYFSMPWVLLRSALAAARRHRREGTFEVFMEAEWKPFVRCAPSNCRSWQKAVQKVRRDARLEAAQAHAESRRAWPAALTQLTRGNFHARVLATPLELHEEAIRMHNCAHRYVEECGDSTMRLFHISCGEKNVPIGTLSLERTSIVAPWKLADIKGPANSPVSAEVVAFAQFVEQAYVDASSVVATTDSTADIRRANRRDPRSVEYDEDCGESPCPICGQERICEEHLLASFDVEEGILGGTLYEYWNAMTEYLKDRIFNAFVNERRRSGISVEIDAVFRKIRYDGFDWRSYDPDALHEFRDWDPICARGAFDNVWLQNEGDSKIFAYLEGKLARTRGVRERSYEISSAPGLTWWGSNYYARDAAGLAATFDGRIRKHAVLVTPKPTGPVSYWLQ